MRFRYIATKPDGKIVEGDREGQSPADILEYLATEGLQPVSLKVIKGVEAIGRKSIFGQNITVEDKVFLTKYLSLMLKVGTDLFKAIDILIADLEKPSLKALLLEIRSSLEKGQPFYTVFAKYPKYFSPVFVNLVRAGEASGNLENVFSTLSAYLQKQQDLRHRIKSAITYPIILLIASFLVLSLLVSVALPKISGVFQQSNTGGEIPTFSKVVFAVGDFFGAYAIIFMPAIIIGAVVAWFVFAKTIAGRRIFYRFTTKIPIVSDVMKKIALQRFATTLASLMKAGLPILEAIEITADAVGSEEIRTALMRVSREGIAKGLTIGEAFRKEAAFPRVVVNLMAVSEKAGHVEDILLTLSNFYESEIDSSIKTMVSFLEPILLLGIGSVIGLIALSIIIPVYQLVGSFSG